MEKEIYLRLESFLQNECKQSNCMEFEIASDCISNDKQKSLGIYRLFSHE